MDPETSQTTTGEEVVLDVRPVIDEGGEPFAMIMDTVAQLDGRDLLLIAPFEPVPLEGVLSAQGYSYEVDKVHDTEWRVRFHQDS
jgi:uncharacterized protein (DUF2249 family)